VIDNPDRLLRILRELYADEDLPRPFLLLTSGGELQAGRSLREVARRCRTTVKRLESISQSEDPVRGVLGCTLESSSKEDVLKKARANLGQLLLGDLAERAFEKIYRGMMGSSELTLKDYREARSETDYRVLNGHGRPVFRINIKFHGTLFRNAETLVGLSPGDCFALATYKIYQALLKQEEEVLPYIFVIVGVPGLTGAHVGGVIPEDLAHLAALVQLSEISGKRDIEDRIVSFLIQQLQPGDMNEAVRQYAEQIEHAEWRVLSARRADILLREKLFDRVYAVRVRAFARNYRNAELDMHFSLKEDLTSLADFPESLKSHGLHGLTARLERGLI